MLKIGFNKTDPDCRKFYFDDSMVLTSNPPKYKIWYMDDENEIDYIVCSDVFYLKPAPNQTVEEKQQPVQQKNMSGTITSNVMTETSTISAPEPVKDTIYLDKVDVVSNNEKVEIVTQPKKRGRKKKETETQNITSSEQINNSREFEYKVIDEYFESGDELESVLNTHGKDGWELCGFEIYKPKITKPTTILCILKRRI